MSTEPRPMAAGAFGLAISSDAGLPGLDVPGAVAGGRRADHSLVDAETLRRRLDGAGLTPIGSSGEGPSRVEYHEHPSGGMLIRTASFGDHLIADRGRTVLSSVAGADPDLWRRYVLGQVLPLTASVQGLEIFHAGAVAVEGGVIAVAGPSGAGKSSLAGALVAGGAAAFFSDDVLALEAGAFELFAYPGTTLLGVPHDQAAAIAAAPFAGPPWMVDERKVVTPVRGERRALPVLAFIRLNRDPGAAEPHFAPCLPDRLMATTFDGVSRGPERLQRLLRVGAMLAADGRAQELSYPAGADPEAVAESILRRIGRSKPIGSHAG